MRHLGSFRMYESVIRELVGRGHELHLVIDRKERLGWQKGLDQLLQDFPSVTWSWAVRHRRVQSWFEFSRFVRIWLDYLRYFDPRYDAAPILRRRAAALLPAWLVGVTDCWPLRTRIGRTCLRRALRLADLALPRTKEIEEALRADQPDVLMITPLIYLGSPQVDMLRSAKVLGIRTVLCVGSWDHLSSKAIIRDVPHRVLVWNETQKEEATALHGVPADQVVVTGAQCYDQWFGRVPSRSAEQFRADVGLARDKPFLLYVCSALFWGSPSEAEYALSWVKSIRESASPLLRDLGLLIRPHPARWAEWQSIDLTPFPNVVLYGSNPIDKGSKDDYFDSLYHSVGVVGLNTSAFLEAGIVGRPVHALLPEGFRDNQEGTLHFHYLMDVGGGLLRVARDFDTHHREIVCSVDGRADNSGFVKAFIRPAGLDVPATDVFVAAIERLGYASPPAPERPPLWVPMLRLLLYPLAVSIRILFRSGGPADGDEDIGQRMKRGIVTSLDRMTREVMRERKLERKRLELQQRVRERSVRMAQKRAATAERHKAREAGRAARIAESRKAKAQRQRQRQKERDAYLRKKRRRSLIRRLLARVGLG